MKASVIVVRGGALCRSFFAAVGSPCLHRTPIMRLIRTEVHLCLAGIPVASSCTQVA